MRYYVGDAWNLHNQQNDAYLCILTNETLRSYGELVMGKGIAGEAALFYPDLPIRLGKIVRESGSQVYVFPDYRLISFPTKKYWRDPSDLDLIQRSAEQLVDAINIFDLKNVVLPAPGIGFGGLQWKDVKPRLCTLENQPVTIASYMELANDN